VPPNSVSFSSKSSNLATPASFLTTQTPTDSSMFPIQPYFVASNVVVEWPNIWSIRAPTLKMPSVVPSFGAAENRKLAALMLPAPCMFCTMTFGLPGM
jgi:hypothetical protein